MAHKKAGGSSKNGRDSNSKRLGVNVGIGKDHTLFAKSEGTVTFSYKGPKKRKFVNVFPN